MYTNSSITSLSLPSASQSTTPVSPASSVLFLHVLAQIKNDASAPLARRTEKTPTFCTDETDIWCDALSDLPASAEDEIWYDASETQQEAPVSFSEDCKILLRQLIARFGEIKESEFIFRGVSWCFPGLPLDLLAAARSVYNALRNGTDIDFAVLDVLAVASGWLLTSGNALSRMALTVRSSLASSLGLEMDESADGQYDALLTALAVLAIVARYCWRTDGRLPVRRILQLPLSLSSLLLRVGRYWGGLGRIAQHANTICTLQSVNARFDCISDEAFRQRTGLGRWSCEAVDDARPLKAQCVIDLPEPQEADGYHRGAARQVVTKKPGAAVIEPETTQPPVFSAGTGHTTLEMTPLVMPMAIVAAQIKAQPWSAGTKIAAALGATLLTSAGVASWFLRGGEVAKSGSPRVDASSSDGSVSGEEQQLLSALIAPLFSDVDLTVPAAAARPVALTQQERSLLSEAIGDIRCSLQNPAPLIAIRPRRSAAIPPTAPDTRTLYWRERLKQTSPGSAEWAPLRELARLSKGKSSSVAVPKESIPFQDTWYTGMDRFDRSAFTDPWFFENIQRLAQDVARSSTADYPDGTLLRDKWMHSDLFWEALYLKILARWGDEIMDSNAALAGDYHSALKQTGEHLLLLKTFGRSSVNLPLFSPEGFPLLQATVASIEHAWGKLLNASDPQQLRLIEGLKSKLWHIDQRQHGNNQTGVENFRYIGVVDHLEKINLSTFSEPFIPELVQLLNSLVALQNGTLHETAHFDQTRFYTELSLLSLKRLLDAEQAGNVESAYNYAVLEEQVADILNDKPGLNSENHLIEKYKKIYIPYRETARIALTEMQGRLDTREIATTSEATTSEAVTPTLELPKAFTGVNLKQVTDYIDNHSNVTLPEVRENIADVVEAGIAKRASEFIDSFMAFTRADIMKPAFYLERWIENTLRSNNLQTLLSPSSAVNISFYAHEFKTGITYDTKEQSFTLRDIVRGVHLEHVYGSYKVHWPQRVGEKLQKTLRDGIDSDIRKDIDKHFENKELPIFYRVMALRAALSYLDKKNKLLGTKREQRDKEQNAFIDGVTGFLEGKVKPQLLAWHEETIPGIILIPSATEAIKVPGRGVLLSLWDNDYHEIPKPGLGVMQLASAHNSRQPPDLQIEQDEKFQSFIKRHNVPRTALAAGKVAAPFHWEPVVLLKGGYQGMAEGSDVKYRAPFQVVDTDDYIRAHIALQKSDLVTLYDNFIVTRSEDVRAQAYTMCNSLSMTIGAMLMISGGLPGIPLAAAVGASVAATLLLEVVPNTALYMLADDDEERQLYLDTIVIAVAVEALGSIPLLSKLPRPDALKRLFLKGVSNTLPPLFTAAEGLLRLAARPLRVERLIPMRNRVSGLSQMVQDELETIIKPVAVSPRHSIRTASSSGTTSSTGSIRSLEAAQGFIRAEQDVWQRIYEALWNQRYRIKFRAVLTWDNAASNTVKIEYLTLVTRQDDFVAITRLAEGCQSSFLCTSEAEWAWRVHDAAVKRDALVKYIDFSNHEQFFAANNKLAALSGTLERDKYIEGAKTLFAPESYQRAIKARTGINYSDIQRVLEQHEQLKGAKKKIKMSGAQGELPAIITEPVRKLPSIAVNTAMLTRDFDAAKLLNNLIAKNKLKLKAYYQRSNLLLPFIKSFVESNGFADIRFRTVLLWKSGKNLPDTHYVVVAASKGIDYVFDLAAARFKKNIKGLSAPLIVRESDWALKYGRNAGERLIKYRDVEADAFPTTSLTEVSLAPGNVFIGGKILNMPEWFLILKNSMVEKMAEFPPPAVLLSERLQQRLANDKLSGLDFTLLDEPELNDLMLRQQVAAITNFGPDIKEFYPVPALESIRKSTKHLTSWYTRAITSAEDYKVAGRDLPTMLASKQLSHDDFQSLTIFKKAFISSYEVMNKLRSLMHMAAHDIDVKVSIIGRLAIFLNDKNLNVLAESYKRLELITEQTWQVLHYHVVTKEMRGIVPVNAINIKDKGLRTTMAATQYGDPLKRIIIFLNNCRYFDMTHVALHEATHLGFNSIDSSYLYVRSELNRSHRKIFSLKQAHRIYGTKIFDDSALRFSLGRIRRTNGNLYDIPLTDHEKIVALARLNKLSMLKANVKMNNADSVVVLFNDLVLNVKTESEIVALPEITGTRVRRSAADSMQQTESSQQIDKFLAEEIIATILLPGELPDDDAISDDEKLTSPGD